MREAAAGFEGICGRLLATLDGFTHNSLDDDVAMVALRFDGVGPEASAGAAPSGMWAAAAPPGTWAAAAPGRGVGRRGARNADIAKSRGLARLRSATMGTNPIWQERRT